MSMVHFSCTITKITQKSYDVGSAAKDVGFWSVHIYKHSKITSFTHDYIVSMTYAFILGPQSLPHSPFSLRVSRHKYCKVTVSQTENKLNPKMAGVDQAGNSFDAKSYDSNMQNV